MIAIEKEQIPNAALWRRVGADRYQRADGCEVVCDSRKSGWRAMVSVRPTGHTPVWQLLMVADQIGQFRTATAAIEAVEAYFSPLSSVD